MKVTVYELREVGEYGDEYAVLRFEVKGADELRTFRKWILHWAENMPSGHELPSGIRCRHAANGNLEMTHNDKVIFVARPIAA